MNNWLPWLQHFGDAAEFPQFGFQDPASSIMEGLIIFNLHLLFVIISIIIVVGWFLYIILVNYIEGENHRKSGFYHNSLLEIVWTSIPTFILLMIASPSFLLLYSLDEIAVPEVSLKIIGHQWYWGYETSDFNTCLKTYHLKYSAYMLSDELLSNMSSRGFLRNLETNKRVLLPSNTHIRLLITSADVLHCWTIPSFGIKIDACPGRLNQVNLFLKRCGLFFGQCSEICGINHGYMPIVVFSVPSEQYYYLVLSNIMKVE